MDDPAAELMKLVSEIIAFKNFLEAQLAEMRSDEWRYESKFGEQLHSTVGMYERALDRSIKALTDVARLGLDERAVRLRERETEALLAAFNRATSFLPAEQSTSLTANFVRELRALDSQSSTVPRRD